MDSLLLRNDSPQFTQYIAPRDRVLAAGECGTLASVFVLTDVDLYCCACDEIGDGVRDCLERGGRGGGVDGFCAGDGGLSLCVGETLGCIGNALPMGTRDCALCADSVPAWSDIKQCCKDKVFEV